MVLGKCDGFYDQQGIGPTVSLEGHLEDRELVDGLEDLGIVGTGLLVIRIQNGSGRKPL